MRKTGALLLILFLLASGLAGFMIFTPSKAQEYTHHEPIEIDGNEEFAEWVANHSWPGDGTEGNPYVIERYDINATGLYTDKYIEISNTDVHFIISNVNMFTDYSYPYQGVYLFNVSNCHIENVTISDVRYGIRLLDCDYITINGNDLLDTSNGLEIYYSTNTTIMNNIFGTHGISIEGESFEEFHSHTITPDNLVNGTPISFYKDTTGIDIIDTPVSQLIVVNCTDVRLANLTISDALGPLMAFVDGLEITGNVITANERNGISIVSSENVTVADNEVGQNDGTGVDIRRSNNIAITNNNISVNNNNGISIQEGNNLTIDSNTVSANNGNGININSASNITVSNNIASGNGNDGIALHFSSDAQIKHNIISKMTREEIEDWREEGYLYWWFLYYEEQTGIGLHYSVNVTLNNNSFDSNGLTLEGDLVQHYNSHTITSDNLANGESILYFTDGDQIEIDGITIGELIIANYSDVKVTNLSITNTDIGLIAAFVDDVLISHNNISSNSIHGVHIHGAKNLDFIENTIWKNSKGVNVESSEDVAFINNYIANEELGVDFSDSDDITFSSNTLSNSQVESGPPNYQIDGTRAINFYYSSNITLTSNNISDNYDGILFNHCPYTYIEKNNIFNNTRGFHIDGSPFTTIKNNSILVVQDGIFMDNSPNAVIIGNSIIMSNRYRALLLEDSDNSIVQNNFVSKTDYGLVISLSANMTINGNIVKYSFYGLRLSFVRDADITGNEFTRNDYGIYLDSSRHNSIINNTVSNNTKGIYFYFSDENHLTYNNISFNVKGIQVENGWKNIFHHNYLVNNTLQVDGQRQRDNFWNDSQGHGNYWSDYKGYDTDGDGVGDTHLPHLGVDYFPLTKNVGNPPKEDSGNGGFSIPFDPMVLLTMVLVVVFLIVIFDIYFRIKKIVRTPKETELMGEQTEGEPTTTEEKGTTDSQDEPIPPPPGQ